MVILQLSNRNSVNGVASCTLYCKRHKPYKSTPSPQECVTVTIVQIPYSGNLRSKSQFSRNRNVKRTWPTEVGEFFLTDS